MPQLLTVQDEKDLSTGLPTFVAAIETEISFPNDGRTVLWISNGSGGAVTYTVAAGRVLGCGFLHPYPEDATEPNTAPNGQIHKTVEFRPERFNYQDGRVIITLSSISSVSVAAVRQSQAGYGGIA